MELFTNLAASYTTTSSYLKPTNALGAGTDVFEIAAIIFAYGFLLLFIFALYYIATAILMGSLFKKAGLKNTAAWIPFYRYYRFLQLGGQNGKLIFLSVSAIGAYFIGMILMTISAWTSSSVLLPITILLFTLGGIADIVYYIFRIIASYNISKKLDKDPVVTLFYVISEFIWWAIIVADKSAKFNDKLGVKRLDK